MNRLTLLVLENPWSESVADNLSVAPFVQGFASWSQTATAYLRSFYSHHELKFWLAEFVKKRRGIGRRVTYLASHGSSGRIGGLPNDSRRINFRNFAAILRQVAGLDGIHLGCCLFGSRHNAEAILRPDHRRRRAVPCRWVAGYATEVDWIDAMLVDLAFWRFLFLDPNHDSWSAASETYRLIPASRDRMKFAVFTNGPGGSLRSSLEEAEQLTSNR